jgi:copper chaperone CopZ
MTSGKLRIQNVKCSGCAEQVKSALLDIPGILNVHISISEATAEIYSEGNLDMDRISEALQKAGFPLAG